MFAAPSASPADPLFSLTLFNSHFNPLQYPAIVDTLTNLQTGTVLAPNDAAFGALLKAATAANIELDPATVETVLVRKRNCCVLGS